MITVRRATKSSLMVAVQRLSLALVAAFAAGGCSHFDIKKNIPWGAGEDGEGAPPLKVAAMWTDTVLNQAGQPAMRGYGGRLMFYAAEGGKPIKVRGTLVVYAFDETGRDTEHVRPDRKYVFTAEQFEKHYSKSPLGHSYSVWLPWDEAGGPRREISLLVRFTPENGPAVVGEASRHNLPGYSDKDVTQYAPAGPTASPAQPDQASAPGTLPVLPAQPLPPTMYPPAPSASQNPVVPVAYQAPVSNAEGVPGLLPNATPTGAAPRRMSTTTINLPSNVRTRPVSPSLGMPQPAGAANAVPFNAAAYSQLTPLQAAAVAAAMNGSPIYGTPNHSTTVTPPAIAAASSGSLPQGSAPATGVATNSAEPVPAVATAAASATHSARQRRQPLGAPLERLTRDRAPWQPSH